MSKQHFDLLTFVARALTCRRCCNEPRHITSGFLDAASDLAERSVRAALGFHRTGNAVGLSLVHHGSSERLGAYAKMRLFSQRRALDDKGCRGRGGSNFPTRLSVQQGRSASVQSLSKRRVHQRPLFILYARSDWESDGGFGCHQWPRGRSTMHLASVPTNLD